MESLIRLGEVARILGVTRPAVHYMVKRGELHRTSTAFGWLYFRPEVEALAIQRAERFELPYQRGGRRLRRTREVSSA